MSRPFDWAEVERLVGPAGMAAMDREVESAPPLTAEQYARLRALFAPVVAERSAVARRDAA